MYVPVIFPQADPPEAERKTANARTRSTEMQTRMSAPDGGATSELTAYSARLYSFRDAPS